MTPVYGIAEISPQEVTFSMARVDRLEKNYWGLELVTRSQFEEAEHVLRAEGQDYELGTSDDCADICRADVAVWAVSERAWDWLPELQASGCRIAHNVKVEKGHKAYKLVYAAPVLDLLDQDNSNVIWNDGLVSWVTDSRLFEWNGEPPLMFQVLYHSRQEYRGVMAGLSGRCYVSQAFVDEYRRRTLTGLDFWLIPRTPRPSKIPAPKNVVVFRP